MMTSSSDGVSDLLSARDAAGAAAAAADVLDLALDGGCAVSETAPDVLNVIDQRGARATLQVYLLSVLINIGRWIGAWERMAAGSADDLVVAGARREAETAASLARVAKRLRDASVPADPEERGLLFRLTGLASDDPGDAVEWIVRVADDEHDPAVAGCAVEAVLVLIARFSAVGEGALPWVRRQLEGPHGDAIRVRLAVAPHDFVGSDIDANRHLIESIVGMTFPHDEYAAMWPSELL
jgi:hypothetical protein